MVRMRFVVKCKDQLHVKFSQNALLELKCIISHGFFLQRNKSLLRLNLSWNGFGFEGCVALAEMLKSNNILTELDLTNNRIHPPALIALIRGLAQNKTLKLLNVSKESMLDVIPRSDHHKKKLKAEVVFILNKTSKHI